MSDGVSEAKEAAQSSDETVPAAPPGTMLALIDRYMTDPSVDVDKFERLLALKERLDAKEAELQFNEARERLARRLADIRIVRTKSVLYDIDRKDPSKGKAEAFKFTPLDDIDKVLRGPLLEEGFTLSDTT